MSTARGDPPLFTRAFVAVLATQAAYGFSAASFFLLPKYLSAELGAGPGPIGIVAARYGAAAVLLMPAAGAWADRFGRLGFLRGGILLQGAASAGFVFVDEMGTLVYALRFLQGLSWALVFASGGAVVADHAPPARMGQAIGMFGVSMLVMNAIAPAATETMATRLGWAATFGLAAGACGVSLLLSAFVTDVRHERPPGVARGVLTAVAARPRSLWWMAIVATNGAAFGAMFTFSQPFALELGMENVSSFFVAYTIAAISVRIGFGPFVDRAGRYRVSLLSGLLYAAAVLSMAALEPGRLAWIGAVFGLAHGFFYPAFNALALEGAAPHERGLFMALFNTAFNAGWSGGGIALGALAETSGYPPVFLWSSALVLAGVVGLWLAPELHGSRGEAQQ